MAYCGGMHESKLEVPDSRTPLGENALRSFDWAGLVATLRARSDLRQVLAGSRGVCPASFDAGAAIALADEKGGIPVGPREGKPAVNPDALNDGKYPWAMPSGEVGDKAQGD